MSEETRQVKKIQDTTYTQSLPGETSVAIRPGIHEYFQ